ncbi:glycosyltransferase family 2 protein [Desulfobacter curvatus]|uniref:glycosyltransferase family 2 protein n=1 Tax=Desulfobacter curvatus TaxID=2290 RepID=UPI0003798035|nr:glycosyltransferase family 2 protein [Desulfobacter curvatus]
MNHQLISIVCPFFNEQEMVSIFINEIYKILNQTHKSFEIVCVNDGSTDSTLEQLLLEKKKRKEIKIVNLSRNFGKEAALTAGLDSSKGDVIIPIDADLQDPPELMLRFLEYWEKGYEVVLAKRNDRSSDSLSKRITAKMFYKVHNIISTTKVPENVGDYRLITRKVLQSLQKLPESQRFMKGLFAWVGYKTAIVEYRRDERKAGCTKFNGWKLWNFALDGITSFSTILLSFWLYLGAAIASVAFIYGSFIVIKTLVLGVDVPGYASLLTIILFMGGIQIIGIGVLGEYIGRLYIESKGRPIYIIDEIL